MTRSRLLLHAAWLVLTAAATACAAEAGPEPIGHVQLAVCCATCCSIDGRCHDEGSRSPSDACLICDPARDDGAWTRVPGCVADGGAPLDAGPPPGPDGGDGDGPGPLVDGGVAGDAGSVDDGRGDASVPPPPPVDAGVADAGSDRDAGGSDADDAGVVVPPPSDGGRPADGGIAPMPDGGGPPRLDGGASRDAGVGGAPDAGAAPDAGVRLDAGRPADAGAPPVDGGLRRDAGTRDAGPDAGDDVRDGGDPSTRDAAPPAPEAEGGSGCAAGARANRAPPLPWLVLAGLLALRGSARTTDRAAESRRRRLQGATTRKVGRPFEESQRRRRRRIGFAATKASF